MAKVIARIKGGIGNQLFCYAASRRLAFVNCAELVLDSESGFERDYNYRRHYALDHFNISSRKANKRESFDKPIRRLSFYFKSGLNRILPYSMRSYLKQEGDDFDPRLLSLKIKRDIYIDGYWQSEAYFFDIFETIRAELKIKPPKDLLNLRMADKINKTNSIAIHVRFFNQSDSVNSKNVSIDYYVNALELMVKKFPDSHYYIFSDQPQQAMAFLKFPNSSVTFVDHNLGDENAYADLWLMAQCRHFIIANSTFSWWGAWLGGGQNKVVIAPAVNISGVGSWGFDGLLPKEWIKL